MSNLAVTLAVPLALGVPSLLLLIAIVLTRQRRQRATEYSRVDSSSSASSASALRKWALLLVSVGIGVTAFYTLAIQVGLSHPESDPLTPELVQATALARNHAPSIAAMRAQLGLLTSNASLLLAAAVANVTWMRTLLPSPSVSSVSPPTLSVPDMQVPVLPNSTINETLSRVEGDRQLWQLLALSTNETNQTAWIGNLQQTASNLSVVLSGFQNLTRAYNSYNGNSTVVGASLFHTSGTSTTALTNPNTFGPLVFYGTQSLGKQFAAGVTTRRYAVRFDARSRVYFHNITVGYYFRQLGRSADASGRFPGFWVADLVNYIEPSYSTEIPWYPQGLFHGFLQLTDGLDYQRVGEPSIINNPSVFQMDCMGAKTTLFMGPVTIDPLLVTPTLQADTIEAAHVVVDTQLSYGYVDYSDARIKFDFSNVQRVFHLKKLRPVTFEWRSDGRPATGFIAQETPLCSHGLGVDPTCIMAYHVASMQALTDRQLTMRENIKAWESIAEKKLFVTTEGLRVRLIDKLGYENVASYM